MPVGGRRDSPHRGLRWRVEPLSKKLHRLLIGRHHGEGRTLPSTPRGRPPHRASEWCWPDLLHCWFHCRWQAIGPVPGRGIVELQFIEVPPEDLKTNVPGGKCGEVAPRDIPRLRFPRDEDAPIFWNEERTSPRPSELSPVDPGMPSFCATRRIDPRRSAYAETPVARPPMPLQRQPQEPPRRR
jgi:hypothetical protein